MPAEADAAVTFAAYDPLGVGIPVSISACNRQYKVLGERRSCRSGAGVQPHSGWIAHAMALTDIPVKDAWADAPVVQKSPKEQEAVPLPTTETPSHVTEMSALPPKRGIDAKRTRTKPRISTPCLTSLPKKTAADLKLERTVQGGVATRGRRIASITRQRIGTKTNSDKQN